MRATARRIGTRVDGIRERVARKRAPSHSVRRARIPKGSGPFCFVIGFNGSRIGAGPRSADRAAGDGGLFNNLPREEPRYWPRLGLALMRM